ncbi:MAG: type VI secretion protein IcmF/TssM N-terminal domain-containing protein [Verrucomicrobiota bacterium]
MEKSAFWQAWGRWVIISVVTLLLLGVGIAYFSGQWKFLLMLLLLVTLGLGLGFFWIGMVRASQSSRFLNKVVSSLSGSVSMDGLSREEIANLGRVKDAFLDGIKEYKTCGKNLYEVPWYVVVGETGSGKTEAIRHSAVGFPARLQDKLQGTGGTYNMHWWFTNQAVLLDTAGRLMFEDAKGAKVTEWQEFLRLIKEFRPRCPINGLLLVIPSTSLIKDSSKEVEQKSAIIARQLYVLQEALGVRFPVFILVTKCDLITGFREFFDSMSNFQSLKQIVGWSNPDPLDKPFQTELVDQYLTDITSEVRKWCMGILQDPVPVATDNRRVDEVDVLYSFPASMAQLSTTLRVYLDNIFTQDAFGLPPLFLRGIYFTSAMRPQGWAPDKELLAALGFEVGETKPVPKPCFLQDLFLKKIFQEKGLIVENSIKSPKKSRRSWKMAMFTAGFAALAVLSVAAWLSVGSLRDSIKRHSDYWSAATRLGWEGNVLKAGLFTPLDRGNYDLIPMTNIEVGGVVMPVGEYHTGLVAIAQRKLDRNWMFPGLVDEYNQNSFSAQRVVFEASVIRPLLGAARRKMSRPASPDASATNLGPALMALIQLEADVQKRQRHPGMNGLTWGQAEQFISPLYQFAAPDPAMADSATLTNLVAAMVWTYGSNKQVQVEWPPKELAEISSPSKSLADHPAINAGLDLFFRSLDHRAQADDGKRRQLDERLSQLKALETCYQNYLELEKKLFEAAQAGVDVDPRYDTLKQAKVEMNKRYEDLTRAGGLGGENGGALGVLTDEMTLLDRVANTAALEYSDCKLFGDIRQRLAEAQQESLRKAKLDEKALAEKMRLEKFLMEWKTNEKYIKVRLELYDDAKRSSASIPSMSDKPGRKGRPLADALQTLAAPIDQRIGEYSGPLKTEAGIIAGYYAKLTATGCRRAYFDNYLKKMREYLAAREAFPLFKDATANLDYSTPADLNDKLKELEDTLGLYQLDFQNSEVESQAVMAGGGEWNKGKALVESVLKVTRALSGSGQGLPAVTVTLLGWDKSVERQKWREHWRGAQFSTQTRKYRGIILGSTTSLNLDAPLVLDDMLVVVVAENENDDSNSLQKRFFMDDRWAMLRLYLGKKPFPAERGLDRRGFTVRLVMDLPDYNKSELPLEIRFDRELPRPDEWPSKLE